MALLLWVSVLLSDLHGEVLERERKNLVEKKIEVKDVNYITRRAKFNLVPVIAPFTLFFGKEDGRPSATTEGTRHACE